MHVSPESNSNQPRENNDFESAKLSNDVQENWEDVSDAEHASQREATTSSTSGSQTTKTLSSRKKRRVQSKTTFHASPTPSRNPSVKKVPTVRKEELQEALTDGVRFTAFYAFDVFKGSIENMRRPLSWLLFLYMLAWAMSRMMSTVRTALSPLCIVPGISKSALCLPDKPAPSVNFEKLVNIQGSTFEQLVGESAGGSQLSINVLRAEMATRDLSLLVRYSDLKSKDNIADMLHTIGIDAKRTGRGLSKLDAKVVGAIDEVMALNNYAMATIGSAHKKAPSPLLRVISPIRLGPTAEEIISEAFTLAMDESEQAIARLIIEAEISSQNLEQLDADIGTLYELITREDKHTSVERDQLLGELWTRLGGNKKTVRDYGDRLALLNDLGEYRKQAVAHVKAALRTLHAMSDDLEVLRERVAAPGLLESKLPLHVHMESIRNGLERLQEGRMTSRGRIVGDETVRMLLKVGSEE
ncbi:hypothetical protein L210DRAFT_3611732 [Boletus edulis BED1]|uniref:Uncharacterized protein n=1 Tax=Boletus edulis BED1 TaxID=1328754 RepID=A0AAD4GG55_BOLED|nr:hypothetical protein L210DRAFT_3611732 [Boletus edulis BED1]